MTDPLRYAGDSHPGDWVAVHGPGELDPFDRTRVSELQPVFESKQLFDNQPLFWDDQETSGSGTGSTHNVNEASSVMTVSATTAGKRIRQTFERHNYQPGKSALVVMTGTLTSLGSGAGIKTGIGLFDDQNGLFFRDNEGTTEVVLRSFFTGSAVDTAIAQSAWNCDKLDGSGKSTITLDITKSQVFVIDFSWLGSGTVRFGFLLFDSIVQVHEFHHANTIDGPYMSTPNLPIRYEIENTGTGAAASMRHTCSAMDVEGGAIETGELRYNSTSNVTISANTAGTIYVICGLRLKTTALDATVDIENISVMNTSGQDFEWLLIFNPTLATVITFSDQTNGTTQFGPGNAGSPSTSTATGGTIIDGGYSKSAQSVGHIKEAIVNALRLGSAIDGTRDEIYLCVRADGANANVLGGLTWREHE